MQTKTGRPSLYKPEYCDEAINFMANGCSIIELSQHLGVGTTTIYRWEEEHSEFREALTRARELSQAHWERKIKFLMIGCDEKGQHVNVSAPLVKLYLANRFGWSDKVETKNDTTTTQIAPIEISDEQYVRIHERLENDY